MTNKPKDSPDPLVRNPTTRARHRKRSLLHSLIIQFKRTKVKRKMLNLNSFQLSI